MALSSMADVPVPDDDDEVEVKGGSPKMQRTSGGGGARRRDADGAITLEDPQKPFSTSRARALQKARPRRSEVPWLN